MGQFSYNICVDKHTTAREFQESNVSFQVSELYSAQHILPLLHLVCAFISEPWVF